MAAIKISTSRPRTIPRSDANGQASKNRKGADHGSDDREDRQVATGDRQAQRCPRFEVLPKRWIVERTLAWISHCRRLARDFERHVRTVVAFVYLAMIRLMLRRLTATHSA